MTKKGHFKDARLLEALDYIDRDLVGEVAVKLRFDDASSLTEEPVMTWRTPFKHWKSLAALAACILLLSIASPLVGYIAQVITDWGAAAGVGTTEEVSDAITDENGVPYTYPMFVDDLEPLTAEEMLEIDELWYKNEYDKTYKELYDYYINNENKKYSESEASELADKRASIVANDIARHCFFNEQYYNDSRYYGKINDCVILVSVGMATMTSTYEIAGHTISFSNYAVIYVVKDGNLIELQEAYDLEYLTDDNIGLISERNAAYTLYLDSYYS